MTDVERQTIGTWLTDLASGAPAPGGGAAAAMQAAMAAALVGMVCSLTIGKPRYAAHEPTMTAARDRGAELRREAMELAGADATAFAALRTAEVAAALIDLTSQIVSGVNVAVLSDVAVAAASARAALDSATVNVETNLAELTDPARREELAARLAGPQAARAEADRIVSEIRARIAAA